MIGLACFIFAPQMELYGGLSGVATGLVVYIALQGLQEPTAWRWVCLAILCGVPIKVYCESMACRSLFAGGMDQEIRVCITSHIAGALSALGWVGIRLRIRRCKARNFPTPVLQREKADGDPAIANYELLSKQ